MTPVRVFAGGGGSTIQEQQVLSRFTRSLPASPTVVAIPWAHPDPDNPDTAQWISTTLRDLGVHRIRVASSIECGPELLDGCDGVLIPGGNTFLLLQRLRQTGLATLLVERIRLGLSCYGGSAGAIVLGCHIGTASHLDSNHVGLEDLRGLDLLHGHALWCHYATSDAPRVAAYRAVFDFPVFALPEDSGVTLDSTGVAAIGPGQVMRFHGTASAEPVPLRAVNERESRSEGTKA